MTREYKLNSNINSLNLYMKNIGEISLLSQEDEYDLAIKAKNGDNDAKNKLIEANLRLASKMAEEIAVYQKMKKRLRTTAYVELAVGIPCFVMGCLPIWTNEQQNIRNLLLGIGGTAAASGGITLIFTIAF